MNDDPDIAIIGAGIAGAALAWHLAPHARVLLLEREAQPGQHSTGRSAAMFMETYGPPQARALTRASRAHYQQPPAGFTDVPLLAPRGVLYVGWQGQEAALEALLAELTATGAPVGRIDAAEALRRVPVLRAEGLLGAVTEPDAMDIDVHALHQGYLRGFKRAGGALRCSAELQSAHRDGDRWTLTLQDGTTLRCPALVNAAGAWADVVAARCGARPVGLQPKRRSAFTFAAPEGMDARAWPTVAAIDETWYFKPDAGQLLGSPANADPVDPHDVVPEELDIALGIHGIEQGTRLTIRRPQRTWAGLRSFAADGELVIGWDAQAPGLFWLAGQGGYGIQSADGAGQLAASLLRGVALPEQLQAQGVDPNAMSPARFASGPG
ncbi:MAG: FAD-binding oxidoreductase [Ideonella sp.]|nr:FAD-binding oxidoreductase [Ideonella sp.]